MTYRHPRASSRRCHSGVSLIEVLVAVVIVSLGVLSVVVLQLVSKRNNLDSKQQMMASQLAFDLIAERVDLAS